MRLTGSVIPGTMRVSAGSGAPCPHCCLCWYLLGLLCTEVLGKGESQAWGGPGESVTSSALRAPDLDGFQMSVCLQQLTRPAFSETKQ